MLFENEPYFKFIQLVAGIHIKTRQFTEKRLRKLNMTYPQLGALMVLIRKDNVTQKELAGLLETDATTVMVLCDSLEKRGWLKRKSDKNDRRINRVVLTERGKDMYAQAIEAIQSGYEDVYHHIPNHELHIVLPFLSEVYKHTKQLLDNNDI
jgi:DNA-binding MarR family transcriptional regulator